MDKVSGDIVTFLRKKDYELIRELGEGASGRTVLLLDTQIDEQFVCKKYVPYNEKVRKELFENFKREMKLLFLINHPNVVRVFNFYLYPESYAGYILMEFVDGTDIESHLQNRPQDFNSVFTQAIEGFAALESNKILHRDIRPANLMVCDSGQLKIIDLGFGKQIKQSDDFAKSVSLNWWCEPPAEFANQIYDFSTEVYFVGKLFENIIRELDVQEFAHKVHLQKMCSKDPYARYSTFAEVQRELQGSRLQSIEFDFQEIKNYQRFSDALAKHISRIRNDAKYVNNPDDVLAKLEQAYFSFMLEETVPDAAVVTRCILVGPYYYTKAGLSVETVKGFLSTMKSLSLEKKKILLANLQTKLDSIPRYTENPFDNDDIPF